MMKRFILGSVALSTILYSQQDSDSNLITDLNTSKIFSIKNSNVQKEVNNQLSITQQLNRINNLAIHKQQKEALSLSKNLYKKYPDNSNVTQMYAKLLFWNGKVNSAYSILKKSGDINSKLYRQVYISKTIKTLKAIKSPTKRLRYINSLDNYAKRDYEVLWIKMKSYITKHQFHNALRTAKELSRLYPKSSEVKESVARLYFWTKQYRKSLNTYYVLRKTTHKRYAKEIRQLKSAMYPKKRKKVEHIVKKSTAPKNIKLLNTNDDLQYKVMKFSKEQEKKDHMIGIGYDYFRFSDERYTDNSKYIEATVPLGSFVLYNKLEDTHRYGLHDIQYSAELYPTMPKPWWGYLSFSFTPSADFYSKYSIGWHQYYDIGSWEFGLGYNFVKYSTMHTNTVIALYTYYFTDKLYFTQTGYYVPSNKSWSLSNKLDYQVEPHHKYYISYIKSDSYESDDQISIALRNDIKSDKYQAGFEISISAHYNLGVDVSYEKFDTINNSYNRKELNTFIRYYW